MSSGADRELGAASVIAVPSASVPDATARDAILSSLYEERSKLTEAQRLGSSSEGDDEYLAELNQYIDQYEAFEIAPKATTDVWQKLEAIAQSLVSLQAAVERAKT